MQNQQRQKADLWGVRMSVGFIISFTLVSTCFKRKLHSTLLTAHYSIFQQTIILEAQDEHSDEQTKKRDGDNQFCKELGNG